MNPFNADTHPGPYLVVEVLGVGDVSVPALAPGPGEPLHQAATRVIEAAAALDERHESVLDAVRRSQRLLEGAGRGEVGRAQVSYALLRTALPDLGDGLAQQDRAYSQLVESLSAYRRLLSSPPAQQASNKSHGQGQKTRPPHRDDDWAVAGERGLVALEAVAAGGVRFRRNAIGEDPYISREKAQWQDPAVFPQTVQRLVVDGLLHQDITENVYRPGQLLSLTAQGEAALRDGRATTSRVSAALGRTTTRTTSGAPSDPAAVPVARTSLATPRSR
ncbi:MULTISPECIES: large ATP-binding protein [unclassified Streptomyces]|uniref:large ATP-binding protein n=1 Tax=unclassified Streptomyces TaxID=2593676 RepID=UPI0024A951CA|nr:MULTISPECIES: large ATP-binding protein [unclassified Streptomyces]